jgi:hypothetical protein
VGGNTDGSGHGCLKTRTLYEEHTARLKINNAAA